MSARISPDDRTALNALIDGELDGAAVSALEARIATDATLRAAHEEILAIRNAVTGLPRPQLPAGFRDRIMTPSVPTLKPTHRWTEGWRGIAAAVGLTAIVTSSATWLLVPRAASLEMLVASAHQRSLLAASPVDVLSSDRHTVKPWLDARLGLSPPAPDLAAQGYPLVGGRVEVLGQQPVPVLVYRHNEHTISVIAIPGSAGSEGPRASAWGGYNMSEWTAAGFRFIAVSDLEASELATFVTDYLGAV